MADMIVPRDLPVTELDILGTEAGPDRICGNAILAELTVHLRDEHAVPEREMAFEADQLAEMAAPASNLLKLTTKLAVAVRLGGWTLDSEPGTYGGMLSRILASALSDVIVLRQAEMRRRELLADSGKPNVNPVAIG